ncbi:MAG: aldehyde dehydrogenase family protein [Alphaproteobacteria bacterium]|nr:aldehyde dehydrogenase family protein [Alphaproteobacteria bacterium]
MSAPENESHKSTIRPWRDGLVVGLAMLVATVACSTVMYRYASKGLLHEVQETLLHVARTAAVMTDGDLHRTLVDNTQKGSADYLRAQQPYREILAANPNIRYIYTVIEKNGKAYFIVDTQQLAGLEKIPESERKDTADIMEAYPEIPETMMYALKERKTLAEDMPYIDEWGTFISAYVPIYDSKQEYIGIVGADIDATDFIARMNAVRLPYYLGLALAVLFSVLVTLVISRVRAGTASKIDGKALESEEAVGHGSERTAATTRMMQAIADARAAQEKLETLGRKGRESLLLAYAEALKNSQPHLVETLARDAKKTMKDAQAEVAASIDIIGKTVRDATLPDMGDMVRERRRLPVGVVGLITSFNFPMVVAHWNIAPALLAGNAVLWKPSEKTPLAAFECKKIWDAVAGDYCDALQIVGGNRELGAAMVADEAVDMISATGSVAMGEAIKKSLAAKKNNSVPPILELGGNNALVIGAQMNDDHLGFALGALLSSFLGTTGQRCTNTRRLIVHEQWCEKTVSGMERLLGEFIASGAMRDPENIYGYNALIDRDAMERFAQAKAQAAAEGGRILFGGEGEPALAVMPSQTSIMHTETFAPLLYIVPYRGDIRDAMALVNAPDNAGLVNGIYTLGAGEVAEFILLNQAGHSVVNSPKGTGTPAFGMGFGGNKASGAGEILWGGDPLAAFTRPGGTRRVAINKLIPLS